MMDSECTDLDLRRVIEYCVKILSYEGRPSDDEIQTCKDIMDIIRRSSK